MFPPDDETAAVTRRSVLAGAGGMAAMSMSGTTLAQAREQGALESLQTDPHTRDVFRSIADAIIPRTPELDPELGAEHGPGALDAEIERYLIWDFDHFQEVRAEALTSVSPERFEVDFAPARGVGDALEPLDADRLLAGSTLDPLADELGLDAATLDLLDFGTLERFAVSVADVPEAGPADLDVVVETANESTHRVMQNYPYAEALAVAFEVVAAEFVARGGNHEPPAPARDQFPAGGLYVRLEPMDRLRCLQFVLDESVVDLLDDAIGAVLPTVGVLKFAVMGVFGLTTLGYYSEWAAYGETKTDTPNERALADDPDEIVSRKQTGYPGPSPGYAEHRGFAVESFRENDWRDDD